MISRRFFIGMAVSAPVLGAFPKLIEAKSIKSRIEAPWISPFLPREIDVELYVDRSTDRLGVRRLDGQSLFEMPLKTIRRLIEMIDQTCCSNSSGVQTYIATTGKLDGDICILICRRGEDIVGTINEVPRTEFRIPYRDVVRLIG